MHFKQKIKSKYFSQKRKVADMLQRKSERLTARAKKMLLFLFCLLFAGMSVVAVVQAFISKAKPLPVQAKMPRIIQQKETPALPFISKREYTRIEQFKNYILMLPASSLDSFKRARPKLLDSIGMVEKYYKNGTMGR